MNRFTRYTAVAILSAIAATAAVHWSGSAAHADSEISMASPAAKFVVRTLAMGTTYQTQRIDTTTGDSWFCSGTKWSKVTDDAPPGPGVYDIDMVYMPDNKTYAVLRIDVVSGRTWYLNNGKWTLFSEP
jgi:hypothetical protein